MEDEECLPENSSLNFYLESIGFSDIQIKKKEDTNILKLNCNLPIANSIPMEVEYIDEETIDEINILISSQMLFEEDVCSIEKLLSSFKIVKNSILKSSFQGVFGVAVIFFGLVLYWIIGSYAFILVSSFYAYKAADFLWTKHFNKVRLKKLALILRGNYDLVRKTFNFVEENNKYFKVHNCDFESATDEFKRGFDHYNNFRFNFGKSLSEIINVLLQSTLNLIRKKPLHDYIENHQYYICNNLSKSFHETADLQKLYQTYLLVQSEFLQRLILTLIPNLALSYSVKDVNKIVTETSLNLLKIKNKLNQKFRVHFLNGVHCSKSKLNFKNNAQNRISKTNYAAKLVSGIHDTSNTFQDLLIKTRIIEENVKSEKISNNIEHELLQIQNNLHECQKTISESFILLKKAYGVMYEQEENLEIKKVDIQIPNGKRNEISVSNSDFDSNVEDEVFEAYFNEDSLGTDLCNFDDWDLENISKRKLQKEFSEKVLKELKVKLTEKAKNWEERESEVLRKKYKNMGSEFFKDNFGDEKFIHKCKSDNLKHDRICNEMKSNVKIVTHNETKYLNKEHLDKIENPNNVIEHILDVRDDSYSVKKNKCLSPNNNNFNVIDHDEIYSSEIKKKILSDLSNARERILKVSNQIEEHYCYTNESSEEDNSVVEN